MKRSEAYHLAQIAVVLSQTISPEGKLEVLRVLLDDEKLAEFTENRDENENAVVVR